MYRKNVASQYLYFGLVNASTGAALTGATVTGKRSIDGAAQGSVTGTISEDAGGQYHIALSQADINGNNIGFLFTASSAIPVNISVVTTAADPTDSVRFGLTALPNAAAGANGGLPLAVDSSGRVDVLKINGTSQTARDIGASVLLSSGTGTGQVDFTSGVVKANATQFAGQTITAAAGVTLPSSVASPTNITAGVITTVTTVTNRVTANTDQLAGQTVTAAAGVTFPTSVASPTNITAGTLTTVTNLTNAPTAGDFTTAMKASLDAATPQNTALVAIKAKTDLLPAVVAGAANGLLINGANAGPMSISGGVTITNSSGTALTCTSSGGNGSGIQANGAGNGHGFQGKGGVAGSGVYAEGGTAGDGFGAVGHGVGAGIVAVGGNTAGPGLYVVGGDSGPGCQMEGGTTVGAGLIISAPAGNSDAMFLQGSGSGRGINSIGGPTGDGIRGVGGATSGHGITAEAPTAGDGLRAIGTNVGINARGGNGAGIVALSTTAEGISAVGGANSPGMAAYAGASDGSDPIYCSGIVAFGDLTGGGASNGLSAVKGTVGAGVDLKATNITGAIAGVQSDTDNIQTRLPAALVSGRMDSSVGAYPGNTAQSGDSYARIGAAGAGLTAIPTVAHVTLVDTTTTLTNAPPAGGDTPGTTTLLARLTATRAGLLDNLDATISSVATAVAAVAASVWAVGSRTLTAFGFGVTVTTNNDKTGYALTGAYDAAKTAAQAGNQMDLVNAPNATAVTAIQSGLATSAAVAALPTASANASEVLKHDWSTITGEAARSLLNAARAIRNRVVIAAGVITVYKEDGTTTAWTETVTTDPAAEPIVAVTP